MVVICYLTKLNVLFIINLKIESIELLYLRKTKKTISLKSACFSFLM